jgi:3-isopropylmalate/(R)-2-methylmalate dehydratase small subunit
VVIAPSFGDIFFQNALKNGLLPIRLPAGIVRELGDEVELTVDVERCRVVTQDGHEIPFELDPFRQRCLLDGLDDIGLTLEHEGDIAAYEAGQERFVETTALPV